MLFIAHYVDDPDKLHVRDKYTDDHMEYLMANTDHIVAAGPLRKDLGAPPVGAVWIVEADDVTSAEAVLDRDPFWIHGLRRSRSILHWYRAAPDYPVTI